METKKTEILRALRVAEDYISGQELCQKLGVSRTAVWKYIKQLQEDGYEIEAVRNRGYCLKEVPDILDASEIQSRINTLWAGKEVVVLEEVDSTNTEAKRLAEKCVGSGTLVVADRQTGGKGRRGRVWDSPKGSSIYMTLLLKPQIPPERASMLTLVMGLSVTQALQQLYNLETTIKWPNDVVSHKKKVSGILTEMSAQVDYIEYLVIGVGINGNMDSFPENLEETAISLKQILGYSINRAELISKIMEIFEKNYEIFQQTRDLSQLVEEYQRVSENYQKQVRVLEPGNEYSGICRGISSMGELLVEREDGTITKVYAGEVSVRGLYSYTD